jgi:cation:H+ antiporter
VLNFAMMAIGLAVLVVGAELLVRSASRLAFMLRIPAVVVGLTIVAFGTSAPELAVSIKAGLTGQADIAVGNVIGSNIFNILFILGLSALITPLLVTQRLVRLDVPVMIVISALAWLLAWNGVIGRAESLGMLVLLAFYVIGLAVFSRDGTSPTPETKNDLTGNHFGQRTLILMSVGILLGLLLLVLGARWFVDGASAIARLFGISELVIGLTLVAVGTSLPELATSVVASVRGERDIAVGNVVGSNIFNMLCVLAVAGLVSPTGIAVSEGALAFDFPIMLAVSFVCLPIFITGAIISRTEGFLFLFYYVLYGFLIVLRATQSPMLPLANNVMLYGVLPATGLLLLFSLGRAYLEVVAFANTMADDVAYAATYAVKNARKILVLIAGVTLLIVGVAMMVLPGPATVVIPLGLALLGTEFIWARRLLKYILDEAQSAVHRLTGQEDDKE